MASNPNRTNGFDILNDVADEGYNGVNVRDFDDGNQHVTVFSDVSRTSWDVDTATGEVSNFHETINDGWESG